MSHSQRIRPTNCPPQNSSASYTSCSLLSNQEYQALDGELRNTTSCKFVHLAHMEGQLLDICAGGCPLFAGWHAASPHRNDFPSSQKVGSIKRPISKSVVSAQLSSPEFEERDLFLSLVLPHNLSEPVRTQIDSASIRQLSAGFVVDSVLLIYNRQHYALPSVHPHVTRSSWSSL